MRARQTLAAAGLPADVPLLRMESARNEVWLAGDMVLRIARGPGSGRLAHEESVIALLADRVPVPTVVASGTSSFGEWMVQRRVPGITLARAWVHLGEAARRTAIEQLGATLRAIHATDASTLAIPLDPPGSFQTSRRPLEGLVRRLAALNLAGTVDPGLLRAASTMVDRAAVNLPPEPTTLVHGDAHLENVLVSNGRISAVLDLEYARAGWPEVDLEVLARFCTAPALSVSADYAGQVKAEDFRSVITWLRSGYPELFERPGLVERVNLCSLDYDVRDLVAMGVPKAPAKELPSHHPLNRLARLVDGRGLLQLIEW